MRRRTGVLTAAAGALALAGAGLILGARPEAAAEGRGAAERPAGTDTALVRIGSGEDQTRAFVAWPAGARKAPVTLVVHEWWGLNSQIRDVGMRLARQGYIAVVPDLYHGRVASDPMEAHELSRGVTDDGAARDLDAAVAWIRAQPRAASGKLGILGFCLGGGVALQYALRSPELGAVVMFYGSPETDPQRLAGLHAPLQAHFGAEDQGIPPKRAAEFREALERAGRKAEVYVYPGAGHAFMHDGLPSYRVDAARQGWARMLAFFQKNLKGE